MPEVFGLAQAGVEGWTQPDVPQHLEAVWSAFRFLARARPASGLGGPGRISVEAIDLYIRRVIGGLHGYRWESFVRKVVTMDLVFIETLLERKESRGAD